MYSIVNATFIFNTWHFSSWSFNAIHFISFPGAFYSLADLKHFPYMHCVVILNLVTKNTCICNPCLP